jgi:hypothetical protein
MLLTPGARCFEDGASTVTPNNSRPFSDVEFIKGHTLEPGYRLQLASRRIVENFLANFLKGLEDDGAFHHEQEAGNNLFLARICFDESVNGEDRLILVELLRMIGQIFVYDSDELRSAERVIGQTNRRA